MRIASLVSRILLGLLFVVFGSNGFLHFLPMAMPAGTAGQFMGSLFDSHYLIFLFSLELISGLLLLFDRFVPLALVILGPILVNILLYHGLMDPKGIVPGVVVTALWFIVFTAHRKYFAGIFTAKAD